MTYSFKSFLKIPAFILVLICLGCGRSDSVGQGGGPIADEGCAIGGKSFVSSARLPPREDECAATNALVLSCEHLRENFTPESAMNFTTNVSHILGTVENQEVRIRVFIRYNESIWKLTTPKMIALEKSDTSSTFISGSVSNDLNVLYLLVEGAWNLGVTPLVEYPLAINEYELGRIDYARQESLRWRERGRNDLSALHEAFAARLEAMVEDPLGPVRSSFDLYCRRVDASEENGGRKLNPRERYDIKSKILRQIQHHLGHDPKWAIEWCNEQVDGE